MNERLTLPDVTLVAVTSVALLPTVQALSASMRQADFGKALLLTDQARPTDAQPDIEWRQIDPLTSKAAYSRFMLHKLADHIETRHALCVQWDGYVLNASAWDPAFLGFDYIGAVWPHFSDAHTVGNGGFSLRSKRLLDACQGLSYDGSEAEDVIIGRVHREMLEANGMRFAPEMAAHRFAYERSAPTGREFGFHGAFNLLGLQSDKALLSLFRELEPGLLTTAEMRELFWQTSKAGRFSLARQLLARLWRRHF